ncbi:MAG TPA: STAS domain-containing protein [Phycisphaerales bacterium]|jgi:anti-sigma B factor antagonist|nr:STAS domain-containing protein [Phycisphaerales bacterium]
MPENANNSAELKVRSEKRDGAVLIIPAGEIDLTSSPTLRVELKRVQADKPARLVIDLSAVPYMDSAGVATLVEAMQAARKSSTKLVLCGMQDKVRSIFEISRLDTVFTIVHDQNAAMGN